MRSEPVRTIRLDQFLKLTGAVGTGGQAKGLIQDGAVRVNGQVETRRSRKLASADVVLVEGQSFQVELDTPESEPRD